MTLYASMLRVALVAPLLSLNLAMGGDLTDDCRVDVADLGLLLAAWGECGAPCDADLDASGVVDGADLGLLLAAWNPEPPPPPVFGSPMPGEELAVGDFDGDGVDDLVGHRLPETATFPPTPSVWYGLGNFAFSEPVDLGPANFYDAATGDLDGDLDPDIVVAGWEGAARVITVYRNLGNRAFGAPEPIESAPLGEKLKQRLRLADLDGDGSRDIVIYDTHLIRHLNNGDGTFGPAAVQSFAAPVVGATFADLDGDGDEDAALVLSGLGVFVCESTGEGILLPDMRPLPVGSSARSARFADADADNQPDLLIARAFPPAMLILPGSGSTFGRPISIDAPSPVHDVDLGDWDGDGDLDAVGACDAGHLVAERTGDVTFAVPILTPLKNTVVSPSFPPKEVEIGRFGCGSVVSSIHDMSVLLVNPTPPGGALRPPLANNEFVTVSGAPTMLVAADFTSDGKPDILIRKGSPLYILPGIDGQLGEPLSTGIVSLGAVEENVAAGDIDGDGDVDLIAWGAVHRMIAPGVLGAAEPLSPGFSWAGALHDLDGDGDLDLVAASSTTVAVFGNDGSGTFVEGFEFPTAGAERITLRLGDVNGDGAADIIAGIQTDEDLHTSINVALNQGNLAFGDRVILPPPGQIADLRVGDFEGDGKVEIAVVSLGKILFYQDVDGTIEQSIAEPFNMAQSVIFADFTGDDRADLLQITFLPTLRLIPGAAEGTPNEGAFFHAGDIGTGAFSTGMPLDIDLDGDMDLVTLLSGRFTVIRNLTIPNPF